MEKGSKIEDNWSTLFFFLIETYNDAKKCDSHTNLQVQSKFRNQLYFYTLAIIQKQN